MHSLATEQKFKEQLRQINSNMASLKWLTKRLIRQVLDIWKLSLANFEASKNEVRLVNFHIN